jgi:hypothetical protein
VGAAVVGAAVVGAAVVGAAVVGAAVVGAAVVGLEAALSVGNGPVPAGLVDDALGVANFPSES